MKGILGLSMALLGPVLAFGIIAHVTSDSVTAVEMAATVGGSNCDCCQLQAYNCNGSSICGAAWYAPPGLIGDKVSFGNKACNFITDPTCPLRTPNNVCYGVC